MNIRHFFKADDSSLNPLLDTGSIKVFITGCIAIILSLLFMGIISIAIISNAVTKKLKDVDLKNMAQAAASTIEGRIGRAVESSLLLANDPSVVQWVQSEDKDFLSEENVKKKMSELVDGSGYDTAFITSALTHNYWSYDVNKFKLLDIVSENDPDDSWFFKSMKLQKKYEINIDFNKELKDTYVWINVLVGPVENPIAVCGTGMNLDSVTDDLIREDSERQIKNDIWLVDKHGIIYLSKNQDQIEKDISEYLSSGILEEMKDLSQGADGFNISEYINRNGERYDLIYKNIGNTDWRLIIQIPRSESLGFLKAVIINTIIACIIIIVIIVVLFNIFSNKIANPYKRALVINLELEKKINERTKELFDRNMKIQDSIEYAKKILEAILPSKEEMKGLLKDYFVIWEPRDTVGGDFYWIKSFSDGCLIIVGDCTGHGVPGALMTTAVISIFNNITDGSCHNNPKEILKEIERQICSSFKSDEINNTISDGLDAGVLFVSNDKKIIFSGARISVFVHDNTGIYEIKGSKDTIDCVIRKRPKHFENREIQYEDGMTIYMATDGLIDQPGGSKGLPFGKKRLISLLKTVCHMDLDRQKIQIQASFKDYSGKETPRDDITLLGLRV